MVTNFDFAAAEGLTLEPNKAFQKTASEVEKIEGMFSPFSMAAVDMIMSLQETQGARGDIIEIGTYKGKSAALLGRHLRGPERLTLVDVSSYLDPTAISPFRDKTDFLQVSSSALRGTMVNYRKRRGTFRFIHIDASHGYEDTFHELGIAEELLAPLGIIAMDDFTNLHYSQNIAAIFRYLYTKRTKLVVLLVTDEKAYLCRKHDLAAYSELLLRRSIAEMRSRGIDAVLARTAFEPDYRAIYMRRREPDEPAFYGTSIYSNQITGY